MTQSGLTIRQHERETLSLRAEFVVAEAHREQVRFSSMSNAAEPHVTRGSATDISSGGLGLLCPQFVPRMCEGRVRIYHPKPVGTAKDGSPIHEVCFEHSVKVRRVILSSHDPEYALGMAFIDPAPDIEQQVTTLLALALGDDNGEGGGADG
jgi:c-di-GMP-binding flagellar brake protein YcgR